MERGIERQQVSPGAHSSVDRVLPSEGRGCWFDPSRARHPHHHKETSLRQPSRRPSLSIVAVAALLGLAATTASAENNWRLRVGAGHVDFREKVGLTAGGAPVPGGSLSLTDDTTLLAEIGYRFTPQWSAWLTLGIPPTTEVKPTGTIEPLGRLGEVRYGPLAGAVHYSFNEGGTLRPYVGAGAVYFAVLDEKDGAISNLRAKSRFGSVIQAGAEFAMTPSIGVYVDVKKIWVKTRATGTVPALGGAPVEARIDLDPVVFSAGLVFDF